METKTLLREVIVQPSSVGIFVVVRTEDAVFDGDTLIGSNGDKSQSFELSGVQAQQVAAALEAQSLWPEGSELVSCNVFPGGDGSVTVSVASRVPIYKDDQLLGYSPTVRGCVEVTPAQTAAVTALIQAFGVAL